MYIHTHAHTHTLQITLVGEDYDYYLNKNTFLFDKDSHIALGALLNLALPIIFHVQEAFRKGFMSKRQA